MKKVLLLVSVFTLFFTLGIQLKEAEGSSSSASSIRVNIFFKESIDTGVLTKYVTEVHNEFPKI